MRHRLLATALALITLYGSAAMGIEEPAYEIVRSDGPIEIRRMAAHLVAETEVDENFRRAGNEGFKRLVRYIGGANQGNTDISMTSPVTQAAPGEKIAMTAPVSQAADGQRFVVRFMLPAAYTLDNVPRPDDARIEIIELPEQHIAVLRYSGTWSERRYAQQEAKLLAWLAVQDLEAAGPAQFARYNSPFSLPFLRRNEVIVPLR